VTTGFCPVGTAYIGKRVHGSRLQGRRLLGHYDYRTSHRVFELLSLGAVGSLLAVLVWGVVGELAERLSPLVAVLILSLMLIAYAVADLLSGLVHLLFDTVGSPDTPLIGQKFIRPFRDHHDDPSAMTRGDFVAVNSDNFFVCLPAILPAAIFLDTHHHPYVAAFLVALVLPVLVTNQIHKWTHVPEAPRAVRWLQCRGLVLSNEHHDAHHAEPRNRNYCITWGALDRLLNRVLARAG
jgi:plasmanylethanolamine desaturase